MEDGLAEVRDKLREYEAQGRLLRWMFTGGAAVAIGTAAALWKAFGGG
jgi:hypothetical protein